MKTSTLCVFGIVLLLSAAMVSAQELREEYCSKQPRAKGKCEGMKCSKDGSMIQGLSCPESRCAHGVVRIEQDLKAPYPQCCPRPICKKA